MLQRPHALPALLVRRVGIGVQRARQDQLIAEIATAAPA